jgi:F-type H+-transporting ATPase subunit b
MLLASSNFLVPNATIIVEVIAFLIVLGFVWKVVLPPLNRMAEERRQKIADALEAADRARAEADETRSERARILDEARQQARQIVAQANRTAEEAKAEALGATEIEQARLVSAAEAEIAMAKRRALDELSAQVASLVISVARQVVGREIDAEAHRSLIDEALSALRQGAETGVAGERAQKV